MTSTSRSSTHSVPKGEAIMLYLISACFLGNNGDGDIRLAVGRRLE
jgi:hypothetical protein